MNAVVTVAIGEKSMRLFELSRWSHAHFAFRIGAQFFPIFHRRFAPQDPKFEKLQIYDLLAIFERIIFLDVDTFVLPTCPNFFVTVPESHFGAFFDSNGGNGDAENPAEANGIREDEIRSFQKIHGELGWRNEYFNSGVMIASRVHREVFSYENGFARSTRFVDQTLLNHRVQKFSVPTVDIGQKCNHFMALNRSIRLYRTRFNAHIIHYAGYEQFYSDYSIVEQMQKDFDHLNGLWRNGSP